jgi:hypothetical protein
MRVSDSLSVTACLFLLRTLRVVRLHRAAQLLISCRMCRQRFPLGSWRKLGPAMSGIMKPHVAADPVHHAGPQCLKSRLKRFLSVLT